MQSVFEYVHVFVTFSYFGQLHQIYIVNCRKGFTILIAFNFVTLVKFQGH